MLAAALLVLLAPAAEVKEAEEQARAHHAAGRKLEALRSWEAAIRATDETVEKARLRDAYLAAGWGDPARVNSRERLKLRGHMLAEVQRVYGKAADDLAGRGDRHAAILVRRALIERLGGPETQPGKQQQARIDGLIEALARPSNADKRRFKQLRAQRKTDKQILAEAKRLLAERKYGAVVALCKDLTVHGDGRPIKDEARALIKEVSKKAAGEFPPKSIAAAKSVIADVRFDRLAVARSRHFLYLGPRKFVDALTERDRMMMDLAYIHQSDLTNQHITFNGVRIVIYYQETYDFGGGLGGGKTIRIGRPAIRAPVAGHLHYHELGHCIFGRGWLHHGFTEGLAEFAAGFTLDSLKQTKAAQNFITRCREQFVRFFLGRKQRYFLVQPYQPSAGFLFSFLPPGEAPFDWAPYRRVFWRMREAQLGAWPEREHQLMRYFGYLLATEYGADVLDQLRRWGWPVGRGDFSRVPGEGETFLHAVRVGEEMLMRGSYRDAEDHLESVLARRPDGWIAARARYGVLRAAMNRQDHDKVKRVREELGIIPAYRILGPFHARRQTKYVIYPVETHYDPTQEEVRYGKEVGTWRPANVRPDGYVDLDQQGFGYPDYACAFALSYVWVDRAMPATIWLGSDDGHTLYVNGELAEKRETSRRFRFDDDFADVELRAGWNRILLKVHNSRNPWGFLMRVTQRDGNPISDIRHSIENHEKGLEYRAPKTKSKAIANDNFRNFSKSKWKVGVGGWTAQAATLRPQATDKRGLWFRFQVDPDKPKDGPANIAWVVSDELAKTRSFEIKLAIPGKGLPAKFGVTLDGENENDGQSGHTLVFDSQGKNMRCHWYRYDRQLYLQPGVEVPEAEEYEVIVRRIGRKWWVTVNGVALFDRVDAEPLPAFGIGLMTWGRNPVFRRFSLHRLTPQR